MCQVSTNISRLRTIRMIPIVRFKFGEANPRDCIDDPSDVLRASAKLKILKLLLIFYPKQQTWFSFILGSNYMTLRFETHSQTQNSKGISHKIGTESENIKPQQTHPTD